MKTTIFNFKRFNLLVKKDLIFNSKFYLLQLLVIFVILFGLFDKNIVKPQIREIHTNIIIITFIILMILSSFNNFKFYKSKNKTINYITLGNSIFEKVLFEFFKIMITATILPIIFTIAFKTSFYIKYMNLKAEILAPSLQEVLVPLSINTKSNEFILNILAVILSGVLLSCICSLVNIIVKKYSLLINIIVVPCLFLLLRNLITELEHAFEIKLKFLLFHPISIFIYILLANMLLVIRLKKIQA